MKKLKHLLLIMQVLLISGAAFAQLSKEYTAFVKNADDSYGKKEFKACAEAFAEGFTLHEKVPSFHRYNAACCWALAGEADPAFEQLFRIAEHGESGYDHLMKDTDLNFLHDDERWGKLTAMVKANKEKLEENYNWDLVNELKVVYEEDQKYRRESQAAYKKYGRDSEEVKALWEVIKEKDAINLEKVTNIIDEHGWLGSDVIGKQGNSALFLVIQHSDLDVQLKYLPMMREAVAKGNARASSLALLEDRTSLRQGKRQIYGSQIGTDPDTGEHYVLPLDDPDNVDKRRAEVGLGLLAEYANRFDVVWDVEAYKQQLPAIEAKRAEQEKLKAEAKKAEENKTKEEVKVISQPTKKKKKKKRKRLFRKGKKK